MNKDATDFIFCNWLLFLYKWPYKNNIFEFLPMEMNVYYLHSLLPEINLVTTFFGHSVSEMG